MRHHRCEPLCESGGDVVGQVDARRCTPVSAARDVTPASSMPHGTIRSRSKEVRSGSTLRPMPCIVAPRATRTPQRAHLALHSSDRRGRLRVRCDPHAGAPLDPMGRKTSPGAHVDDGRLQRAHVLDHINGGGQANDRVDRELAGAVPCGLPAPVDVEDRYVARFDEGAVGSFPGVRSAATV